VARPPEPPTIRPAEPGEAFAVRDLAQRAYAPWVEVIGRRPAPMDDDYERHVTAGEVFVLTIDGMITALVVLIPQPDHLLLDNVAVEPSHHGQGLGRRMMQFAEDEARRGGMGELRLFTHSSMVRNVDLYKRLGFVETHRGSVGGFDRVFMSKTLAP
jgi:ribosomal protein S18 acetylase RimI-like enzyme